MDDREILVDNENPGESVISSHGAPTRKNNLYKVVLSSYICPILIGQTLAYSSGAIPSIQKDPHIECSPSQISWFGSIITIGAAVGSLAAGPACERFGRKFVMLIGLALFSIGWMLLCMDISSMETAIVGRLKTGVACGVMSIACPTYIGEVTTADVRGFFGAGFQFMVTVGILMGYLAGRWLVWQHAALFSLSFTAVGALLVFSMVPSSPRWLLMRKDRTSARRNLAYIRAQDVSSPLVAKELEEMEESVLLQTQHGNASIREILSTRHLRTPLLIMLVIHAGQQLCGINCILFYAETIFAAAGMTDANLASILLGLSQVVGTVISSSLMDRAGRRFWLMTSAVGMVICLTIFGVYENYNMRGVGPSWMEYIGLASIVLFSLSFALGEGPVPWLLIGEFFDNRAKGTCSALCGTVNWGASFLLTFFLQQMFAGLGQDWTYWLFALLTAVVAIFEFVFLPETRGKSLDEIASQFQ